MSRREQAKEENRARIRASAERIIRTEGIDKLTMRRLAEDAGVSLRTPYNLFGSKTDVLIALLEGAGFDPGDALALRDEQLVMEQLFATLDHIEAFFDSDEKFYREVYGGIMSSAHPDVRSTNVERVVAMCQELMTHAAAKNELQIDTNTRELGRYLGVQLLAVLGMWGAEFLSNQESIRQVRRAWCGILLQHCSNASHRAVDAAYQSVALTGS
ncbi:transcriptional regulator, TetR family [gamma proteobacterium NOR5-3]|nr:transcriptional regulator, TetR family [gamma proteobacterium NOR5-3]